MDSEIEWMVAKSKVGGVCVKYENNSVHHHE